MRSFCFLGCIRTSWWSCLRVRKAAETRNLSCGSYQSEGADPRDAEPFSCSELAQVETCESARHPLEAQKWH